MVLVAVAALKQPLVMEAVAVAVQVTLLLALIQQPIQVGQVAIIQEVQVGALPVQPELVVVVVAVVARVQQVEQEVPTTIGRLLLVTELVVAVVVEATPPVKPVEMVVYMVPVAVAVV